MVVSGRISVLDACATIASDCEYIVFRLDGNTPDERRGQILDDFRDCSGAKAMVSVVERGW